MSPPRHGAAAATDANPAESWYCNGQQRPCGNSKGDRYINWGSAKTCNKCGVRKGAAFGGIHIHGGNPTRHVRNTATPINTEQQFKHERRDRRSGNTNLQRAEQGDIVRRLQQERDALRAKLDAKIAGEEAGMDESEGESAASPTTDEQGPTLAQLYKMRKAYRDIGLPTTAAEAIQVATQISAKEHAQLASKPPNIRLQSAEREILTAQTVLTSTEARQKELVAEQERLRLRVDANNMQVAAAQKDVEAAVQRKTELLAELGKQANRGPAPAAQVQVQHVVQACQKVPAEALAALGIGTEQANQLIQLVFNSMSADVSISTPVPKDHTGENLDTRSGSTGSSNHPKSDAVMELSGSALTKRADEAGDSPVPLKAIKT
jgi:hypothetical protein